MNRTTAFMGISSVALLGVILIQVFWIWKTAQLKADVFNEKAHIVLAKTAEAISKDQAAFSNNHVYLDEAAMHTVDSLLTCYFKLYGIDMEYSFELAKGAGGYTFFNPVFSTQTDPQEGYQACMSSVPTGNHLYSLKVKFPHRKQFILEEMGIPFIVSVVLILIVLVISWIALISLQKEKRISEHTNQFLNNMTHEFKTPLTNIALAGKMIAKENGGTANTKISDYTGIILEENEKLRLQVEQVLSISALERGEVPLLKAPVDMHGCVLQAVRSMDLQLQSAGGTLGLHLEATETMVNGDKDHLVGMVCNLVDNAIKYTQGTPAIEISTYNQDEYLVIVVSDEGIGIEKEYIPRLFHKYYRVPTGNVHDVKGFGLGLAYVKHMVEVHQGNITVKSEKGKGTSFSIRLPYVKGHI